MKCPQIRLIKVGLVMLFRIGQNTVKVKGNPYESKIQLAPIDFK